MTEIDNYYNWVAFKYIYLEDSFVLKVEETAQSVAFIVDAVLNEEHPLYSLPKNGEVYCYHKATIIFPNPVLVTWGNRSIIPEEITDENDLGNIDIFYKNDNGYYLEGDWGDVWIKSDTVKIIFFQETS